jgi:hypothetical protein
MKFEMLKLLIKKRPQYHKFKSFDVTQTGGTQKVSVMTAADDVYYLLSQ